MRPTRTIGKSKAGLKEKSRGSVLNIDIKFLIIAHFPLANCSDKQCSPQNPNRFLLSNIEHIVNISINNI